MKNFKFDQTAAIDKLLKKDSEITAAYEVTRENLKITNKQRNDFEIHYNEILKKNEDLET